MKKSIIIIAVAAIFFSACNSSDNKTTDTAKNTDTTTNATNTTTNNNAGTASIKEVLSHYLELKNALTNDNSKQAATHGNALVEALGKIDKASLTGDQKKVFDDAADDAKEMAEHIGGSGDKIEHQREHFDMLSKDIYDLIKAFGAGQTLYQDFCPMFNDKKGATWLSETKEIKNPYMGKKMSTCGQVKEEIKQ